MKLCKLPSDTIKKLDCIYKMGKKQELSFNDNWYKLQYEPLGISINDWLLYLCDKMGIIGIF